MATGGDPGLSRPSHAAPPYFPKDVSEQSEARKGPEFTPARKYFRRATPHRRGCDAPQKLAAAAPQRASGFMLEASSGSPWRRCGSQLENGHRGHMFQNMWGGLWWSRPPEETPHMPAGGLLQGLVGVPEQGGHDKGERNWGNFRAGQVRRTFEGAEWCAAKTRYCADALFSGMHCITFANCHRNTSPT